MGFGVNSVEIKSGGKVLGSVDIQVFEDIPSAIAYFEAQSEGVEGASGEVYTLGLINGAHRSNQMNTRRAALTRSASPMTQLKQAMKSDPAAAAQVQALLVQLGIVPSPAKDEEVEGTEEFTTGI